MGSKHAPLGVRVWRHIDRRSEDECWPWTGCIVLGYGHVRGASSGGKPGRMLKAHRVVYELLVGPIPDGLELDHTCHNGTGCPGGHTCPHRACVNPAHLEPVPGVVNQRRGNGFAGRAARQTECKRGHDLTDPANIKPNSRGARQCRACSNIARRDRYQRLGR